MSSAADCDLGPLGCAAGWSVEDRSTSAAATAPEVAAAHLPLRRAQHLGCSPGLPSHALFQYALPHQPNLQLALGCAHMRQHSQHSHRADGEPK